MGIKIMALYLAVRTKTEKRLRRGRKTGKMEAYTFSWTAIPVIVCWWRMQLPVAVFMSLNVQRTVDKAGIS